MKNLIIKTVELFSKKYDLKTLRIQGKKLCASIMIKGVIPWVLRAVSALNSIDTSILPPRPAGPNRQPAPASAGLACSITSPNLWSFFGKRVNYSQKSGAYLPRHR